MGFLQERNSPEKQVTHHDACGLMLNHAALSPVHNLISYLSYHLGSYRIISQLSIPILGIWGSSTPHCSQEATPQAPISEPRDPAWDAFKQVQKAEDSKDPAWTASERARKADKRDPMWEVCNNLM